MRQLLTMLLTFVPVLAQNPFEGAVPQAKTTDTVMELSLEHAIASGLKANLGAVLADENLKSAEGNRLVARSKLLPTLDARLGETSQQLNLQAFGFSSFPGIPTIVGPFGVFDARAAMSATLLNLRARRNAEAASEYLRSADLDQQDARDAVALVVCALYIQAVTGASRIEAGKAQVAAAEALYQQAVDFKKNGLVPAIEVLRAQVEWQAQKQRLIGFQNGYQKDMLRLARAIGLADGQVFTLSERLPDAVQPGVGIDAAIAAAYKGRKDYLSLATRVKAAELTRRAASAGRYPELNFHGDYGAMGKSPAESHGTFAAGVSLDIPLFEGGRVKGEEMQAEAALRRQRAQLDELRGRVAFEVRTALLDIQSAWDQVEVSRSAVQLARQQQEQARDRFANGVTNNLEVVQAQEALATADENYIASLYAYYAARASLERATGSAEKNLPKMLAGTK